MAYKLTIVQQHEYLHGTVTGENTEANIMGYIRELLGECTARNCSRVLIEERLDGPRLGTFELFELASEASRLASGLFKAIAFVDVYSDGEAMRFAENVAVNRGLPVAMFTTVADAEKWLLESGDPRKK